MPHNQTTSNNPDVLTPVIEGLDDLFKSLILLQDELTPLFSNEKSKLNASQLQEIKDLYHTVSDENGVLSLQLKNSPEMQSKINFLSTKVWHEDKIGALKGYAPSLAIGGGSGLAFAGLCIEATVVEASAAACITEGVVEGALMGARVLNPWFLVPSVVFMGTGWFSSYMARKLSFTIQEALGLYDEAEKSDDPMLTKAEKILNAELGYGVDGRYKATRIIRYPSTSYDQFEFINLLLAQIHLKKELDGCYEEFQRIIDSKYASKNIKGMALVGQLDMLSPTSKWTFYKKGTKATGGEAMSVAERMQLLYPKAKELNDSHQELVKLYFNRIWSAYNSMLEAVRSGVCLRSQDEFLKQELAINKIINFQGVHVLRYMGKRGELAEILLCFIQAVSHVMHDVHNKNTKQHHTSKSSTFSGRDESELAITKMSACINLINEYRLNTVLEDHSLDNKVLNKIQEYIEKYYRHCEANPNISEEAKNIRSGLIFRRKMSATQTQAEMVADNALSKDHNVTKSLREAKVSFAKIKLNKG